MSDTRTVAVMLHDDRHADPEITVFEDESVAIVFARTRAEECNRFDDLDETLTEGMRRAGWLYFARYGEGNSIRVELQEVRKQ